MPFVLERHPADGTEMKFTFRTPFSCFQERRFFFFSGKRVKRNE
jgi:hypothetical protein